LRLSKKYDACQAFEKSKVRGEDLTQIIDFKVGLMQEFTSVS